MIKNNKSSRDGYEKCPLKLETRILCLQPMTYSLCLCTKY